MTEIEYQALKSEMRALAAKVLLDWLVGMQRARFALLPYHERSLALTEMKTKLSRAREDYSTLAVPWLSPEISDLQAAGFQEAFDALSEKLLSDVAGSP